jgi:hypothetical protein
VAAARTSVATFPASAEAGYSVRDVDLTPYVGDVIEVRFMFDEQTPIDDAPPDVWQLTDLHLEVNPLP